jgi:tetratricopeptide (TPR) repeat protein
MSTLILRDATLAICGAPETRENYGQMLADRTREVRDMDSKTLRECLRVLIDTDGLGEDADVEVLCALMIIGIAKPEICEQEGFSGLALARRVASRLERQGQPDSALAIIEELRSMYPGHQALERDYDAVLGRLGMVLNLADRYFDRSQQLLAEGNIEEAIGWLREVLLLDSSRKDVARQIRDLRLKDARPKSKLNVRWGLLGMSICLPLALGGVVQREYRLSGQYSDLTAAVEGDLESSKARLSSMSEFVEAYPIWHGSISIERELSELRLEVDRLEILLDRKLRLEQQQAEEQLVLINALRHAARQKVSFGRFTEALSLFEEARRKAPADWVHLVRVDRHIKDLRVHLADLDMGKETR